MGRKPLGDKGKWAQLRIRLTAEERATLDEKCGDMHVSTWAREVLLAAPAVKPKRKRPRKPKGS